MTFLGAKCHVTGQLFIYYLALCYLDKYTYVHIGIGENVMICVCMLYVGLCKVILYVCCYS